MAASSGRMAFVCGVALVTAMCGGTDLSQTGPSPVTPPPAPAPGPAPSPQPPSNGKVEIAVLPNPVPFSGQPITDASGCANSKNTWFYEQVITETGGSEVTLQSRVDRFDGFSVNNLTGLSIVVPANGSITLKSRWCSATNTEHSAQSSFNGTDARGNFIAVTGPVVRLMKQ